MQPETGSIPTPRLPVVRRLACHRRTPTIVTATSRTAGSISTPRTAHSSDHRFDLTTHPERTATSTCLCSACAETSRSAPATTSLPTSSYDSIAPRGFGPNCRRCAAPHDRPQPVHRPSAEDGGSRRSRCRNLCHRLSVVAEGGRTQTRLRRVRRANGAGSDHRTGRRCHRQRRPQPDGHRSIRLLTVPHPNGGPRHLLCLRLPAGLADVLRSAAAVDGEAIDPRAVISNSPRIPMQWCRVSDERPAITTRRDTARPVSALHGRVVHIWGVGGLGSWIAEFVARAGVREPFFTTRGTSPVASWSDRTTPKRTSAR